MSRIAEQAVLAAAILCPERICEASLTGSDFADARCGAAWEAVMDMRRNGAPLDPVTVSERTGLPLSDMLGMVEAMPTGQNLAWYARQVREDAVERNGRMCVEDWAANGDQGSAWVLGLIERLRGVELPDMSSGTTLREGLLDAFRCIDTAHEGGSPAGDSVPCGLADLDRVLRGLRRGVVTIIGARPSVGKSSLLATIARNVGLAGMPVDLYSIEDRGRSLVLRLLQQQARVSTGAAVDGQSTPMELQRLHSAASELDRADILVDDHVPNNIDRFVATVERNATRRKTALVGIDYVQLIGVGGRSRQGRDAEIGEISRAISRVVRRMDCACLLLSQLNRQAESEAPTLAHLRECGSLEADADCVVLLDDLRWRGGRPEGCPVTVARVAKNKHGSTGRVILQWTPRYTLFEDADAELQERAKSAMTERQPVKRTWKQEAMPQHRQQPDD
jgi:replicative DNA helicase